MLSTAFTLSGLQLADGLITHPPLIPETVNQHEAAETLRGKKREKDTQSQKGSDTQRHITHVTSQNIDPAVDPLGVWHG